MKPKHLSGIVLAVDKFFSPLILFFSKFGVTANHITLLQAPFVVVMFFALIKHNFSLATALLGITLILDVLDGSWARVTNTANELGHKYDKVLDLFGIYAFLASTFIISNSLSLSLRSLVVALGIVNAVLYFSNEFVQPELYCGVRAFGFIGLLSFGFMDFAIGTALVVGLAMLAIKIFRFQSRHKPVGGQTAASQEQQQI